MQDNAHICLPCMQLDHSSMGGRRIRVERTAKGAGSRGSRGDNLRRLKQEQAARNSADLDSAIAGALASAAPGGLQAQHIDDGVRSFLLTLPDA